MQYPQTRAELIDRRYTAKGQGRCRACGETMEWWGTPLGKSIPMNVMPFDDSPAVPHWSTCPNADEFRKSTPARTPNQPNGTFKPGSQPYIPPSNPYPPTEAEISDDEIPF